MIDDETRGIAGRMRRWLLASAVGSVLVLANAAPAGAQEVDIRVEPESPAPGATVTVTVNDAPPDETVVVQLGTEEQTATTDASGSATVMIVAPTTPGEALGTVRVGAVDWPIRVVVQGAVDATTTTPPPTTTTTTVPPLPTTPPPVTGLDDTATLVGLGAGLVAAGAGLVWFARRSSLVVLPKGSVVHYRFDDDRHRDR